MGWVVSLNLFYFGLVPKSEWFCTFYFHSISKFNFIKSRSCWCAVGAKTNVLQSVGFVFWVAALLLLPKRWLFVFHFLFVYCRSCRLLGWGIIESRRGISPLRSHGTVRESLPSYGSCYPIMLLFQPSNDKTAMGSRLVSIDISYTISYYKKQMKCK